MLFMKFQIEQGGTPDITLVITLTFLCVFLGGMVQILLGVLGGGNLIKFIPYPVIAGFMNGIAVIIFITQIEPFLGITTGKLFDNLSISWLTRSANSLIVLTGASTIGIIVLSGKITKKVPAALVGLILGTGVYLLVGAVLGPELLVFEKNPYIIGEIPRGIPVPKNFVEFFAILQNINGDLIRILIPAALSLGVLGAIDSLLTSLVADVETKTRHNSNKELIGQGIGNMVSSLFGGVAGAGATVRTLVNVKNGGRTKKSKTNAGQVQPRY